MFRSRWWVMGIGLMVGIGGVGCQRGGDDIRPEAVSFRPTFEGGQWITYQTPGLRVFVEGAQFAKDFQAEVISEVKETPAISLPPGYAVASPVVHFVVPRDAIARIPETDGVGSLFRGIVVELPVYEHAPFYAAGVVVNGYPYGVLYFPQELKQGRIMAVKVPLRYYDLSMTWRGEESRYLDIEVFALSPIPVDPPKVQGIPVSCSNLLAGACSGLHKYDPSSGKWRWLFRVADRVTLNIFDKSITIPKMTLNEGQPEPIHVAFVHGLQFGYSLGGGWIGPKPDQWNDFIQKIRQVVGNNDLVGYYAYIHSGGQGFSWASHDLNEVMRAVNSASSDASSLPQADIEFLIGHSLGGLIVRAYAHQHMGSYPWPRDANARLARVTTLASPYHGSFLADMGLQIVTGEDEAYLQRFAEYIVRKAGFQCGWGLLQDLATYVDQFKVAALDLGFTLPGVGTVTLEDLLPMQSLRELAYDWFAPLYVYIPRCGRVTLSPGDADFPRELNMGHPVRDLMSAERSKHGYIYNYYVKEFGNGNMFLSAGSMLLAMFHNDPADYPGQPSVVPNRRFNDGAVWYRSARGDGCCGSFLDLRVMPNARDHFAARAGDQEVLNWVANHVQEVVNMWKQRFQQYRMFVLAWGRAPDIQQLDQSFYLDILSGVYSRNLDLLVWPVRSGQRDALPVLPEPGFAENRLAGVYLEGDADHGGPERAFISPKAGYEYYFVGKKVVNGDDIGFGPLTIRFDVPLDGKRARFYIFDANGRIQQMITPNDWGCSGLSDIDGCTQDPTEGEDEEPGGPGEEYWVIGKLSNGHFVSINQSVEAVDTTIVEQLGGGMCRYRTALKWPGPNNTYPLNWTVTEDVCDGGGAVAMTRP